MMNDFKRNSGRTGPTSIDGKAKAAMNSMKAGLHARTNNLLPGESMTEYRRLVAGVFADLAPLGTLEEAECWFIIQLLVRRQRCERFEAGAGHRSVECNQIEAAKVTDTTLPPNETDLANISALPRQVFIAKLHPVKAHIARQFDKAYARLERLQARRGRIAEHENPKTNLGDVHPRIAAFVGDE